MELFGEEKKERSGINKGYLIGALIGVIAIGAGIFALSLQPPAEDQRAKILEAAHKEGTPEFAELTKDIIIATNENTVQSPNGFGAITMFIVGNIRNKGTRTIDILEVNVAVVDSYNKVLKEKRVLVAPTQFGTIGPNETVTVTPQLDGFDKKDDRANIRWRVTAIRAAQ